jgi:glycosyltransferase involved in cell wall biosynthesis
MRKNSLLVVTPVIPRNQFSGEQIYTYNLYRALSKYLDITLVGNEDAGTPGLTLDWAKEVITVPRKRLGKYWSVFSPYPSGIFQFYSGGIRSALHELINGGRQYDAIDCNSYLMYGAAKYFNDRYEKSKGNRIPTILVTHNVEAMSRIGMAERSQNFFVKKAFQWDSAKIGWHERRALRSFDEVTAITPDDAAYMNRIVGKDVLAVVPGYDGVRLPGHMITCETKRQVIVLGSYMWEAKRQNVLDLVQAASERFTRANITLKIVGMAPASLIEAMKAFPFVEITGAVDSFEEHLLESRIAIIAEGVGGGFKLKSLDYIFHKIPMAILNGSISGVPISPDKDFLGYDSIDELVAGIVGEIDNLDKLNNMASAAYRSCENAFDWDSRAQSLSGLIERLIYQQAK